MSRFEIDSDTTEDMVVATINFARGRNLSSRKTARAVLKALRTNTAPASDDIPAPTGAHRNTQFRRR